MANDSESGDTTEKKKDHKAAALGRKGGLKGGRARADKLGAEALSASGSRAATARWLRASHMGVLPIAGVTIPCAVLTNGTRVLSQRGFYSALGGSTPTKRARDEELPSFLSAKNLEPFISNELRTTTSTPIVYRFEDMDDIGRKRPVTAHGIDARLIPDICDVFLMAREKGVLLHQQQHLARAAEILLRGLARVGIIALVDEATGYQAERDREELAKILDAYIAEELRPWVRRFPHEFFKQIHRLQGWTYTEKQTKHPLYVGKLINQYIYDRLPPGVHEELKRKNPAIDGRRKTQHHRWLSEHTGIPHLDKQVTAVTTLLAVSDDKAMFETLLRKRFPKSGDQPSLLPLSALKPAAKYSEDDSGDVSE
jgi:hypothetical protein